MRKKKMKENGWKRISEKYLNKTKWKKIDDEKWREGKKEWKWINNIAKNSKISCKS